MSADWVGDVLRFWFGLDNERRWKADPVFDEEIRERFQALWSGKRQLPVGEFLSQPLTALAAIILFDQFPRNMFRGSAEQFATDHLALQLAREAIDRGFDDELARDERVFMYMPFEHSENLADQKQSVRLFTALGDGFFTGFAQKHHDIIAKFGRFPHRNAMLGRAPRPEEIAAGDVVPW